MAQQNFKNHSQIVYGYYLSTGVPILVLIGFSVYKIIKGDMSTDVAIMFLLTGWILLMMLFRSRGFALKAQDRAIRAEESLRYFQLTGRRLPQQLTLRQIIALRFASDEELPALTEAALRENLSNKEIKQKIQNWRADEYRV
jgi:uncharacterized membrane protein